MRSSASTAPARTGKQRLLASCAIAAGMAALALGGPALAQVQGTGQVVAGPGLGTATITNNPPAKPNTTQVVTAGNQTIINWTPTDTAPAGAPIDFLPATNTLEYYGTGNYTVLNRFIAVDPLTGLPIPISRQIALNGNVNSYVGSPAAGAGAVQGGNIWFYNAGGILIGARAVINVGSLVLTANDIDTTGGLFGPGGEIRFRGASGSTSSIDISPQSFISAANVGNPGSSYIALVAPRINQGGLIDVDGSAALVAAEQADIIINNGLFDINVTVGAEGGNAITHTGVTSGPSHAQGDTDQSRIYLVAIPKNDAVTMLVSGQLGYQDAAVAQMEPDGAVVLSAGFNIDNGALVGPAVGPANITIADTIFQSSVTARASGDLVAGPLATIPAGGPVVVAPPPHLGRLIVQGNATFLGDASAAVNVGANQLVGATGSFTVLSAGVGAVPGNASLNVTGGQFVAGLNLQIQAPGTPDAATGNATGGTASLNVSGGGVVTLPNGSVLVSASGNATVGTAGTGGNGSGGTASITVTGAGSALQISNSVGAQANGRGGGIIAPNLAADQGGNGTGGTATISVENAGRITAGINIVAAAAGFGQVGNIQSGGGTGGTARIELSGARSTIQSTQTSASALGQGGGNISDPINGTILALAGGDGQGGSATIDIDADATSVANLGATLVNASGTGGGAGGSENTAGGDGIGGDATFTVDGGIAVNVDSLTMNAFGLSGGALSPSATTGFAGDSDGGTIAITVNGGSALLSGSSIQLDASAGSEVGENRGDSLGGDVSVTAIGSGGNSTISAQSDFLVAANAGGFSTSIPQSTGTSTGGNIDFTADGGTITAGSFGVTAQAASDNTSGAGGTAQGGTIDFRVANTGVFSATDSAGASLFTVDAAAGVSQGGTAANAGRIGATIDGGTMSFAHTSFFSSTGIAGGDTSGAGNIVLGLGGTIRFELFDNNLNPSILNFQNILASADGRAAAPFEGQAFLRGTAAGNGGNVTIDVQGGQLNGSTLQISADGFSGIVTGNTGEGRGGQAIYTQTGGAVTVGDLVVSATGFGGNGGRILTGGSGFGGTATIDLLGGTLDATNISAVAAGAGGVGQTGDDGDPLNPADGTDGGFGQGGTATINLDGTAVVTTTTLNALASGVGGDGGNFVSSNGVLGNGGNGGNGQGGTAEINLVEGTLNTNGITADAGGFGGFGGNLNDLNALPVSGGAVGGNGGYGQGGTATIGLGTAVNAGGTVGAFAIGAGGTGGTSNTGGNGGEALGGTAQVIVTDFDAGALGVVLDASAVGGAGGDGHDGDGGFGGRANGGTARVAANGPGAHAIVTQANFITTATGGIGGNAALLPGNTPFFGPRGGGGGDGGGGTIEIAANGGTIEIAPTRGVVALSSNGTGGEGGAGADNPGSITLPGPDGMPGTMDDIVIGGVGGDGGLGGFGFGGTVRLSADLGGTISSGGASVALDVGGTAGAGGAPGTGPGGIGSSGITSTIGGRIQLQSLGAGTINLGDTSITANGDVAGRIELLSQGTIRLASLTAEALGAATLTNNDTDTAPHGIFLDVTGGTIQTDGAVTLATGGSLGVYAQDDGQLNVGGDLTVDVDDQVDIRHDFRSGTAPTIQTGGSASFTAVNSIRSAPGSLVSAGTSLSMTATGVNGAIDVDSLDAATLTLLLAQFGRINVYGTTTSGDDLTANAAGEVAIADATAGDDISLAGDTVVAGGLITNGTGLDSELDGSNIFVGTTGAASVAHAEADNDFTADVGSFTTGLDTIITGGDIDIASPGAVDLGNSQAGGFISVTGQSIVFNAIDAGTTVGLNATGTDDGAEGITGVDITAGGNITLTGDVVRVSGVVRSGGSLAATTDDGDVRIVATEVDGNIFLDAAGDISGSFIAGGNVNLRAGDDINGQAVANGGYVDPNGNVSEGYVFAIAGDELNLSGSSAATMFGARAGGTAFVVNSSAGEDMLVIAGTDATVRNSGAGDDMAVQGGTSVSVSGIETFGTGVDTRTLSYGTPAAGGPDGFMIAGSMANESNIALTAPTIIANNVVAFDNLTMTATGLVTTTGTIRSGLVTDITGSSLDLESITAGTDIILTSTAGDIRAIGALSAGHDLTIDSATTGQFADLAAGDDIRITATGDVSAASLLTTAGGLDNESDFSGAYITTAGSIAVTGTTNTVGQTRLTAGGTVDTGAITADYTYIDAVGAINVTGDITSGGMFIEGSSVDIRNAQGNSGEIVLRATDSDVTVDGDVTTLASLLVEAAGAITVTGTARGNNFVQMTGGSIDVADVDSSTFVSLTSTAGAINSTGTISAGTDVLIDAATGGQFNALVAGDDVSINAGGDVTVATITAEGSNPQGEEVGSNVAGSVAGTLIVTGSTFAASDVTFNATSISLQDVEAGASFTATTTGGPLTLTSADAGNNIDLTSARDVLATGTLQSGAATTVTGRNLDLQSVIAGTDVDLTATVGNIVTNGDVSGFNVTFDANGDIAHDNDSLLSAGNALTLTAGGDIDVGNASSGGDMNFDAGGAIAANALTSDRNILLGAGGLIELTGDVDAGLALRVQGDAIELNDIAVDVGELGLFATTGGVHATGTINANGPLTVIGAGAVEMTGDIDAAAFTDIRGSSVTVGNLASGSSISLTATNGAVNSAGTIDAGANIFIATTAGGSFNRLIAGDDIGITGSGDVGVTFMDATGDNPEGEEIGSNVEFNLDGNVVLGHGEAAGDFTVNATSFSTGLNSIVAEDDIEITTSGASNLGNSTAGGNIIVIAQSIDFNALDAGLGVSLAANGDAPGAEGIRGVSIAAGDDIGLSGNSIAIGGAITGGGSFEAFATGGDAAFDTVNSVQRMIVEAGGDIGGNFTSTGDIRMFAFGNIGVTANALGGATDPDGFVYDGNLFIDAEGDVVLTNSSAGRMLGVNALGAAELTNVSAGEDLLVRTGGFGNVLLPVAGANGVALTNVTAGDDLEIRSVGDITASNVRATGQGTDGFILDYGANGFTISQGEGGAGAVDGSDVVMTSGEGAINAAGLSAADDILLVAAGAIALNGAQTLGTGVTGSGANIRTSGGTTILSGVEAFDDLVVNASGTLTVATPASAGRDIDIAATTVEIAALTAPNNAQIDVLDAGRDLGVRSATTINGGAVAAGRDLSLSAGDSIALARTVSGAGGTTTLAGANGVNVNTVISGSTTDITADTGAIVIGGLTSAGPISLVGDSIAVGGTGGNAVFANIQTDVGDATIFGGGNMSVTAGSVAGRALIRSDGSLAVTQLSGDDVELSGETSLTLGTVTAADDLGATTRGMLTVNGAVVGRDMLLGSDDIIIGANGRLGTGGTTETLQVANITPDSTTYVGGTGTRDGYHIDATEMTRLFGTDITILAPDQANNNGEFVALAPGALAVPIASVGSSTPPNVIIDDFTMTAGSSTSNLGTNGSLTIRTQGKARVIGDAAFTGMGDDNAFRINADDSIEVILGEGTIRLTGSSTATPGGMLVLESEDVIVATADAIADVAAAADIDAIDERLGQNDGIVLNDGALFAGGMDVSVEGGFYVQNSGEGTRFAQRRGLTFGALGLNVNVEGADSRIVINGVHLGPSGQVTGLDAIPLLSIDGFVIGSGPLSGSGLAFDSGSTMNGCLIVSSTTCAFLEFESSFPVQDVVNDEDEDEEQGDDGEGMGLPTPLITMRDLDPLTGEPLLDDPVTGAGNDDLWTPPAE